MINFRPFKALRPKAELADKVASLPYDVMNTNEAKDMVKENPYSFLRVTRSEIDLDHLASPYIDKVYQKAKDNLEKMLDDNILVEDEKPMFYLYRQVMDGRSQTGIVGCASIDDYIDGKIKKHEFTRPEKEIDRINHFDFTDANTEPVFLTYKTKDDLTKIIKNWTEKYNPVYDFQSEDGIGHSLWVVDDEHTIEEIKEQFGEIEAIYIADGHHRTASGASVGLKRREEFPDYTGQEEFNFLLSVVFPQEDLYVMDYNRLVKDLNNHTLEEFLLEIEKYFYIREEDSIFKPSVKHMFGMYLDNQWYSLKAKDNTYDKNDLLSQLDANILQNYILDPILNVKNPRTDTRIDFVGGIRGLEELERRVNEDMTLAFSLFPTSMDDLLAVADMDQVMPPKSTWFEPKLRSGLFVHRLK